MTHLGHSKQQNVLCREDQGITSTIQIDPERITEVPPPYQASPTQLIDSQDVIIIADEKFRDIAPEKGIEYWKSYSDKLRESSDTACKRMICAMGPKKSLFYYIGEENTPWIYHSPDLDHLHTVSEALVNGWLIKVPYQVALSPHGAGYFAYASHSDGSVWRFIDVPLSTRPLTWKARKRVDDTVKAYERLKEWLTNHVVSAADVRTTQVVFGPEGRYMAWKPDGTWCGEDLPADLCMELKKRQSVDGKDILPLRITFGMGNAWAALWQDGSYTVYLDKKYRQLAKLLSRYPGHQITYIALNACENTTDYFIAFSSMILGYTMTKPHREIIGRCWERQNLEWSRRLKMRLQVTSDGPDGRTRRIFQSIDALEGASENSITQANEKEHRAEQAVSLTVESSESQYTQRRRLQKKVPQFASSRSFLSHPGMVRSSDVNGLENNKE